MSVLNRRLKRIKGKDFRGVVLDRVKMPKAVRNSLLTQRPHSKYLMRCRNGSRSWTVPRQINCGPAIEADLLLLYFVV